MIKLDFKRTFFGLLLICLFLPSSTAKAESLLIPISVIDNLARERSDYRRSFGCKDSSPCGAYDTSKPNVPIVGNSHSTDGFTAFSASFPEINFVAMTAKGCAPFSEPVRGEECTDFVEEVAEHLRSTGPLKAVVVNTRMLPGNGRPEALADYVSELSQGGYRVIVVGSSPTYKREVPDLYLRLASEDNPFPDMSNQMETDSFDPDAVVRKATVAAGGVFIDRRPFFCPNGTCRTYTEAGELMFIDAHHMSAAGAYELGRYIRANYPGLFAD